MLKLHFSRMAVDITGDIRLEQSDKHLIVVTNTPMILRTGQEIIMTVNAPDLSDPVSLWPHLGLVLTTVEKLDNARTKLILKFVKPASFLNVSYNESIVCFKCKS